MHIYKKAPVCKKIPDAEIPDYIINFCKNRHTTSLTGQLVNLINEETGLLLCTTSPANVLAINTNRCKSTTPIPPWCLMEGKETKRTSPIVEIRPVFQFNRCSRNPSTLLEKITKLKTTRDITDNQKLCVEQYEGPGHLANTIRSCKAAAFLISPLKEVSYINFDVAHAVNLLDYTVIAKNTINKDNILLSFLSLLEFNTKGIPIFLVTVVFPFSSVLNDQVMSCYAPKGACIEYFVTDGKTKAVDLNTKLLVSDTIDGSLFVDGTVGVFGPNTCALRIFANEKKANSQSLEKILKYHNNRCFQSQRLDRFWPWAKNEEIGSVKQKSR